MCCNYFPNLYSFCHNWKLLIIGCSGSQSIKSSKHNKIYLSYLLKGTMCIRPHKNVNSRIIEHQLALDTIGKCYRTLSTNIYTIKGRWIYIDKQADSISTIDLRYCDSIIPSSYLLIDFSRNLRWTVQIVAQKILIPVAIAETAGATSLIPHQLSVCKNSSI